MLRYVGGGFLVGVPARDLTEAEVKAQGWDRGELVGSGLYVDVAKEGDSRIAPTRTTEDKRARRTGSQAGEGK